MIATLFTKGIRPKIAILSARLTISLCSAIIGLVCTPDDGGCNYGRRSANDTSALLSFLFLALSAYKRTRRP